MPKRFQSWNFFHKGPACILTTIALLALFGCGPTTVTPAQNNNDSLDHSLEETLSEANPEANTQEQQNQEPALEVSTKAVIIDIDGNSEASPQRTIKVEGDSVFTSKPTYLSGIILTGQAASNCMIFGEDIVKSEEILKTDPSQVLLEELITDPIERQNFTSELKAYLNKKYELLKVCKESKNTYVLFIEPNERGLVVSLWDEEQKILKEFEKVNISDYAYDFIPDVVEGKSIVAAPYGDAGHIFWRFYLLNNSTLKMEKIEDCEGQFLTDEQGQAIEPKFEYSCELEYKP